MNVFKPPSFLFLLSQKEPVCLKLFALKCLYTNKLPLAINLVSPKETVAFTGFQGYRSDQLVWLSPAIAKHALKFRLVSIS